jgi:hypothetical protein
MKLFGQKWIWAPNIMARNMRFEMNHGFGGAVPFADTPISKIWQFDSLIVCALKACGSSWFEHSLNV